MFQPGEETGNGARTMINAGLLNDKIVCAYAMHVDAKKPLGILDYGYGQTFASNDSFDVIVNGEFSRCQSI